MTAPGREPDAQERAEVVDEIRRTEGLEGLEHTSAAASTLAEYGSESQFRRSVRALLVGFASPAGA